MSDSKQNWFKRHKVLTVIGVIILIAIIGGAAGGGDKTNTNSSTSDGSGVTKAEDKPATTVKLNEPARDGKFEFIIKGVECGKTTVGTNEYLTKKAQGQFCLMTVNIKNIGNEAQGFFGSNQKLLNAQSQQFAADDVAGSYLDQNYTTLFSNINPGNSVEGVVVFDVPADTQITQAQLHDSAFSNGVKVNLQ